MTTEEKNDVLVSTGSEVFEPYASAMSAYRELLGVVGRMDPEDTVMVRGRGGVTFIEVADVKALLDFYVKHMTVNS